MYYFCDVTDKYFNVFKLSLLYLYKFQFALYNRIVQISQHKEIFNDLNCESLKKNPLIASQFSQAGNKLNTGDNFIFSLEWNL